MLEPVEDKRVRRSSKTNPNQSNSIDSTTKIEQIPTIFGKTNHSSMQTDDMGRGNNGSIAAQSRSDATGAASTQQSNVVNILTVNNGKPVTKADTKDMLTRQTDVS